MIQFIAGAIFGGVIVYALAWIAADDDDWQEPPEEEDDDDSKRIP